MPVSEDFYESKSQRTEFRANWIPSNNEKVLVYGLSEGDFRVYFFARMLINGGHQHVYWMRGGLAEIELAKKLGVMK